MTGLSVRRSPAGDYDVVDVAGRIIATGLSVAEAQARAERPQGKRATKPPRSRRKFRDSAEKSTNLRRF